MCLLLVGCQPVSHYPSVHRDRSIPTGGDWTRKNTSTTSGDISIQELARRLHLEVKQTNESYVTLSNTHNTVLIFTHTDGAFYVNGQPCGKVGVTRTQEGVLHVKSSLVPRMGSHLKVVVRGRSPQVRTNRQRLSMPQGIVVVDPGHGGKDPGATSVLGFPEKEINLAVGLQLAKELRDKGFQVIMTRDTDRYITLEDRADLANRHRADLFISVHADYCATPEVTGFTIYTARDAAWRTHQVANSVKQSLLHSGQQTRGIRKADFRVLVQTRCPAILVELGYLSNYWESRRLRDGNNQRRLAQAIASGTAQLWARKGSQNEGRILSLDRSVATGTYAAP